MTAALTPASSRQLETRRLALTGIIWCAAALYYLSYVNIGLNLWDEGVPLHGALRLLRGDFVYRDFYGYQPGCYLLYAVSFKLFGISILSPRIVMALWGSLLPALTFYLSSSLAPCAYAFVPTVMALVAPCCYYNRFYPLVTVTGLWLIFRFLEKPSLHNALLGLSSAVALFYFTLELGIVFIGVFMLLLLFYPWHAAKMKRGQGILVGFIVLATTIVAPMLWFHQDIHLRWLVQYILHLIFGIREGWSNPFPVPYISNRSSIFGMDGVIESLWYPIPLFVYAASAVMLLWLSRRQLVPMVKRRQLFATIGVGLYVYSLVMWRAGWGNLLRCLHPAYVLIAWWSWQLMSRVSRRTGLSSVLSLAVIILGAIHVSAFIIYLLVAGDEPAGAMAMRRLATAEVQQQRAPVWCEPDIARIVNEVAPIIKTQLHDDDELLTMPLSPLFNFLSNHLNRSFHEWFIPGTFMSAREEAAFIDWLENRKIPMVVYRDIAIDGNENRRLSAYAPQLFSFVLQKYHLIKLVGRYALLMKNEEKVIEDLVTWCALTQQWESSGAAQPAEYGADSFDRALLQKGSGVIRIEIPTEAPCSFITRAWSMQALPPETAKVNVITADGTMSFALDSSRLDGEIEFRINLPGQLQSIELVVGPLEPSTEPVAAGASVWWVEPQLVRLVL